MTILNSPEQICKLALAKVATTVEEITDIQTSPSTDLEILFSVLYDQSKRAVLRLHPWNFAIIRVLLAASSTAPLFGFSAAYPLPSDFIRVAGVGTDNEITDYQLETDSTGQKIILVNDTHYSTTALPFRYVFDISNVDAFDPLFIEVLSAKLALEVAPQLTQVSNTALTRCKEFFDSWLKTSCSVDGQDRPPIRRQTSKIHTERRRVLGTGTASQYYS